MSTLAQEKCKAVKGDEPPLTRDQIEELLPQLPGWSLIEREGIPRLERAFKFKNFLQALAFTNQVGGVAESEDHHPALLTEWGKVTVTLWTHRIKGLHRNDFIMAAKADQLFSGQLSS